VIPTPESVDAEFLTGLLRAAGHAAAEVRAFRSEQIGTGQIGMCVRYDLDLVSNADGAEAQDDVPRSLVGKFASDDPTSRGTGVQLRSYLKEVQFYRELAARLSIATPRCYFADIVGDGPEFALFLEDMRPAAQGDQLEGCSADVARAAVLELVGLHAPSWLDATLTGIEWLGQPSRESGELTRMMYGAQLPGFLKRYGHALDADQRGIIERLGSAWPVADALPAPFSLIHVDYRLDNLLIDSRTTPPRVTTVDWQSITLGSPLGDVAYFNGAGLLPDERRKVERDLVREYHDALAKAGVSDYAWDDCWNDYRRGTFAGFGVTVIASMLVVQTERGDEMFTAMARRHSQHALDLDAAEFLDV